MTYTNRFGYGSYPMRAVARYLNENGPATALSIVDNATLVSGKPLKTSRFSLTRIQVSSLLTQHPDFFVPQRANNSNLYMVKSDSMLLGKMEPAKKQRKEVRKA